MYKQAAAFMNKTTPLHKLTIFHSPEHSNIMAALSAYK
jgi:hypothetical protein